MKLNHEIKKKETFSCEMCPKEFDLFSYLQRHKKTVHQISEMSKAVFCHNCGKSFPNQRNLEKNSNVKNVKSILPKKGI